MLTIMHNTESLYLIYCMYGHLTFYRQDRFSDKTTDVTILVQMSNPVLHLLGQHRSEYRHYKIEYSSGVVVMKSFKSSWHRILQTH